MRGRLNKQIAADLLIAEQTVKQHRGRVMEKIGVRSVAELVQNWDAAGASFE
ncbi:LuxR C-terminal-related transcriptional regulator [Variovorax humicola]|uniref:LuxR C-terminal-related transcriptional regulator n=1 Tax=Variovorax humicola TaxID=1769758 RepID=A0ABU8WCY0_9BURK